MMPAAARSTLLAQHDRLRTQLALCAALAARLRAGEDVRVELESALVRIRYAFAEHNETEEMLLEPMLQRSDAWGPRRIDRMLEEHAAEHVMFRNLLTGPTADVAARMEDLTEELEAHMAAEERTFLSPAVLRDP
jgi:iron-sulfur cluster repair protein YtfE (RIC family)